MTISVLLSVYNKEKAVYLDRALRSIWDDQTLKPNQIVLVEDGPLGSDLEQVVLGFKSRVGEVLCIVRNEQNLGLTKSLNIGIEHVASELIARMDSDDISAPDRFKLQHDYFELHPEIHILGGSLQEFDENTPRLAVRNYPLTPDKVKTYICKASPLAHPTVMMRHCIFAKGLKYDESFRTSQDIALWFDAIIAGYQIANLPDITIFFRRDMEVFRRRGRKKAWNEYRIYMRGIFRLYGLFTYRYIYPLMRLLFRMMPSRFIRYVYGSFLRHFVLSK